MCYNLYDSHLACNLTFSIFYKPRILLMDTECFTYIVLNWPYLCGCCANFVLRMTSVTQLKTPTRFYINRDCNISFKSRICLLYQQWHKISVHKNCICQSACSLHKWAQGWTFKPAWNITLLSWSSLTLDTVRKLCWVCSHKIVRK